MKHSTANMERYHRHILLKEIGPEGQRKLNNAAVLIVGVGGLGSPVSLYLAAAGVGRIGLMDDDTVSESNLQRQVIYTTEEIGLPKVVCAEKRLKALSPETIIETYPYRLENENAVSIISQYDIVVDGCDNYTTRYLINDTCLQLGKPYVYGTIGEFQGQVAVFNYLNGFSYRDIYPDESYLTSLPRPEQGVMGAVPGIVGSIEAAETIKIITGAGNTLNNRLLTIDILNMEVNILSFQK